MTILAWGGVAAMGILVALIAWAELTADDEDARHRRDWWQKRERR